MPRHVPRLLAAGVVLAALTACSFMIQPGVEHGHRAEDFDPALLAAHGVAVGGVVVADGVESSVANDAPDPTAWAALVYGRFLAQEPPVVAVPLPIVEDLAGAELTAARRAYGSRGNVSAAGLNALRQRVPRARYLALARIEDDELEYRTRDRGDLPPDEREMRPSDLVPEPDTPPATAGRHARRAVTLAMDLFDLQQGESIWRARVERRREIIVEHYSPQKAGDLKITTAAGDPEATRIEAPEPDLDGLEIEKLIDDCLAELVTNLCGSSRAAE